MFIINWKIAFVVLAIFIFSYIILIPMYEKTLKVYKKIQDILTRLQASINEYIESYSTTKTLRLEEINLSDIDMILEESKKEILKSSKIIEIHNAMFSLFTFFSVIMIILIGGNELILGVRISFNNNVIS